MNLTIIIRPTVLTASMALLLTLAGAATCTAVDNEKTLGKANRALRAGDFERAEKILRPVLGQVWDFAVDCIKRSLAFLYDGSAAIYHLIAQRPEILLGLGIAVLLLGGVYPMMFSDDDSKKVSLKSPALKRKGVSSLSALQVAGLLISAGAIVMLIRHPHA